MKKQVLFLFVLSISLYGYEVSLKDVVLQNRSKISTLKAQISEQKERIDGLISLVEGMNSTIQELQEDKKLTSNSNNTVLLKELGKMIDKINNDYVSKKELQHILAKYNVSTSKTQKTSKVSKNKDIQPISNSSTLKDIYSQAMKLYIQKDYKESIKRFELCDKKGYKVAKADFYLGEMAYYSKDYESALFYYKKSAGLDTQASYMPVLILHTAISLDRTNQKEQAKLFYQNVIEAYPQTKSANIAQNRLEKL
jgi:TolA-binding protein